MGIERFLSHFSHKPVAACSSRSFRLERKVLNVFLKKNSPRHMGREGKAWSVKCVRNEGAVGV